jgi:hypothetical protein
MAMKMLSAYWRNGDTKSEMTGNLEKAYIGFLINLDYKRLYFFKIMVYL